MRFVHRGDIVKIRSWDSMINEFGGSCGIIRASVIFLDSMRELCGTRRRVGTVFNIGLYVSSFHTSLSGGAICYISADMLVGECKLVPGEVQE